LLVKAGADANARSLENNFERQVTAEPRMQARPAGGFTPLLYAARKGCVECARILVEEGKADINLTDPDRVTPLLLATINLNFDTAAWLVAHGADVNKWDTWGRSPIYEAVDMNTLPTGGRADRPSPDQTSGVQLIDMLLKAGANPNLQLKLFPPYRSLRDDRGADGLLTVGTTPLLRAAKAGDVPAIKLLLAAGALVDLPTATGATPLLAAAGSGSSGIDTRARYRTEARAVESAKLLLDAGADVNARDKSGSTALHAAASAGWNKLVETLAAYHADLFAKDGRGRMAVDLTGGEAGATGRSASIEASPETEALLRRLMAAARPAGAMP
jgi:ankyrin repeat protein